MTPEDTPKKRRLGRFADLARRTAQGVDARAGSARARRCGQCGAARPAGTDLSVCAFCDAPFEAAGGLAPAPMPEGEGGPAGGNGE